MKNNNFIIVGSSGGIGNQLVADLAKNNRLLLGYHNEKPNDRLPNTISAPVDARSFAVSYTHLTLPTSDLV